MGGKTKQSQRTKNNVRPSSSGRSAELLSLSTGLGAVSAPAGQLPLGAKLFPTLASAALVDAALSADFSLCFKKLNKKDPITRTKALQELTELIEKSKVDDAVAALPSWAHMYKVLTIDVDRKVREATQACHAKLVSVCGRLIAPHLRQLLPAWLQAQNDDHAPAAQRAETSLKSTFPENKLPEVLAFCKVEVMTHLLENLLGNVDAVVNKKIEDAEEREQQYTLVVSSSQRALQLMVTHLPHEQRQWLADAIKPLFNSNVFWKRANHRNAQIRASWFSLLGSVCSVVPAALSSCVFGGRRALSALVAQEAHPAAAHAQLHALVALMNAHPEWYEWLDRKDALVKRVLDILENGGWGEAKALTAVLLSVLSHLPEQTLTKEFYENFFSAIFVGLEKKTVLSSKSERCAWITSLAECLRHLSRQRHDFVVSTATSVHRRWVERVLAMPGEGPLRASLVRHSAAEMADTVEAWLARDDARGEQLARNFFENIGATIVAQADAADGDAARVVEGHVMLLRALKAGAGARTGGGGGRAITFEGDDRVEPQPRAQQPQRRLAAGGPASRLYQHQLQLTASRACAAHLSRAAAVPALLPLLADFDSCELFASLAEQLGASSPLQLFERVLAPWLCDDTDDARNEAALKITFMLLKHLSDEEQDAVLAFFSRCPPGVVERAVRESASAAQWAVGSVRRWLRGHDVRAAMKRIANKVVHDNDAQAKSLLLVCLSTDDSGEMLIGPAAVSDVMRVFAHALGDVEGSCVDPCAAVATRLLEATADADADHVDADAYDDLIAALFKLNLTLKRGDERVSVQTWCEALAAWHDALAGLDARRGHALVDRFIAHVHQRFEQSAGDADVAEHVASLCPHLLRGDGGGEGRGAEAEALVKAVLRPAGPAIGCVEAAALLYDCLEGRLSCPLLDDAQVATGGDMSRDDAVAFCDAALFRALLLRTLLFGAGADGVDDSTTLLERDYFVEQIAEVVHDLSIVDSLQHGFAYWEHYAVIDSAHARLTSLVSDLSAGTLVAARGRVAARLAEAAAARGRHWAAARRLFDVTDGANEEHTATDMPDFTELEQVVTGDGFFHNLQVNTWSCSNAEASLGVRFAVMCRAWACAHVLSAHAQAAERAQFAHDATRCLPRRDVDVVVDAYYRRNATMLYERDVSIDDVSWRDVTAVCAVLDFLTASVQARGWDMPQHHWDFATISLASLVSSLRKSQHNWHTPKVSMLCVSVSRLLCAVTQFIGSVAEESQRRQPSPHVADLPKEWRDVFAPTVYADLIAILLHVLEHPSREVSISSSRSLHALSQCAPLFDYSSVPRHLAPSLSDVCRTLCASLLSPSHHAYKYLAYHALRAIEKPLHEEDVSKLSAWSASPAEGEGALPKPEFAFAHFERSWSTSLELLDAALHHITVGEESCSMAPWSDSEGVALAALLLTTALLQMCQRHERSLMQHYIQLFRESNYAELLVCSCLRLLPADVAAFALDASGQAPAPQRKEYFLEEPALQAARGPAGAVGRLACRALALALGGPMAGAARGAWAGLRPRGAQALQRLATAYISPALVRAQLAEVKAHERSIEDAHVQLHWSAGEVTCALSVEEREVELRIVLSRSHPLVAPALQSSWAAAPGVGWLAVFLSHQCGSVLQALRMWASAVTARVEASPQCYVCYCRLHPATGRLPRAACRQCRNRFHNDCLRKWFASSAKPNCPLCRSAF